MDQVTEPRIGAFLSIASPFDASKPWSFPCVAEIHPEPKKLTYLIVTNVQDNYMTCIEAHKVQTYDTFFWEPQGRVLTVSLHMVCIKTIHSPGEISAPVEMSWSIQKHPNCSELLKWYFSPRDNRSFPLYQLVDWAYFSDKDSRKRLQCSKTSDKQKVDYFIERVSLFRDWAMESKETTCSISMDKFDDPFILSMNGKSFSRKSVEDMVQRLANTDTEIRLGDITLYASHLNGLHAYRNMTLPSVSDRQESQSHSEELRFNRTAIKHKTFQMDLVEKYNIPAVGTYIKSCRADQDGIWPIAAIFDVYATARGLANSSETICHGETMENLQLTCLKFPPYHPKCKDGMVVFRNVLFQDCTIDMTCWCGLQVKSSLFNRCEIYMTRDMRPTRMPQTTWHKCNIHLKASDYKDTKPGDTMQISTTTKSRLGHLFDCVDFMEDCLVQFL